MVAYDYVEASDSPTAKKRTRRGDGSCCNCPIFRCCLSICCRLFRCGLCCLCNLVCQIICVVLVIAAILAIIVWLLFRPSNLEFHADEASLAEFKLDGNTLRYNMALNVSARNPNSRLAIVYEDIEALAYYQDQEFSDEKLQTFSQETETTRTIHAEFQGENTVILGDEERATYDEENSVGEFSIDVNVQLKIAMKLWFLPSPFSLKPSFDCHLNVPLLNASGKPFQGTDCHFDWRKILH